MSARRTRKPAAATETQEQAPAAPKAAPDNNGMSPDQALGIVAQVIKAVPLKHDDWQKVVLAVGCLERLVAQEKKG